MNRSQMQESKIKRMRSNILSHNDIEVNVCVYAWMRLFTDIQLLRSYYFLSFILLSFCKNHKTHCERIHSEIVELKAETITTTATTTWREKKKEYRPMIWDVLYWGPPSHRHNVTPEVLFSIFSCSLRQHRSRSSLQFTTF